MSVQIFDTISEKIYSDELFLHAQNNWTVLPQVLYNLSRALGTDRVRGEIHDVNKMSGIRNKGAYLKKRLENLIERQGGQSA